MFIPYVLESSARVAYQEAMQGQVSTRILERTGAAEIRRTELIQPLWNNYGTLSRLLLRGGAYPSVIVKHIKLPTRAVHPRGFAGSIARQRKVRSYQVETHWYQHQNQLVPEGAPTPRCIDAFVDGGELFLLLEDLSTRGYSQVLESASTHEITLVLGWLASFHAHFLGDAAEGLWPSGTYWHLATRPEELARIEGTTLHRHASLLDARLRCAAFPTLVHGDAKLANFLFREDRQRVAAVDFQYVGQGAAMTDVAYFLGSCLDGDDCAAREGELLEVYFSALRDCLPAGVDAVALEAEWRSLYPVAWADFQRFMTGWSPGHRKLTRYSDATTRRAIDEMTVELLESARAACLDAGRFIQASHGRSLEVGSKGFASRAADVVTEIDHQAQAIILRRLAPVTRRYDLGVLAEEGEQDESRLSKHAFWAIDPLDGTSHFIEGSSGYATSIALVSRSGKPLLGVVYEPAHGRLFEVVSGRGATLNGDPIVPQAAADACGGPTRWFADQSLRDHASFARYQALFDIHFVGGAVTNVLQLLTEPNGIYAKAPRASRGGCAIWDLAAVSLMLEECSGSVRTYDGAPLNLNRPEHTFFHDVGFVFAGCGVDLEAVMKQL